MPAEPNPRPPFTTALFYVWVGSALAFLTLIRIFAPDYRPVFESLDVDPPGLTVLLFDFESLIRNPLALLLVLGILGASTLPFLRRRPNGDGRAVRKLYAGLAVIGLLAVASIWMGIGYPIQKLQARLSESQSEQPMPPVRRGPR